MSEPMRAWWAYWATFAIGAALWIGVAIAQPKGTMRAVLHEPVWLFLLLAPIVAAAASATSPPSNPDGMPAGRRITIDLGVQMSADHRVVTLRFIGGPIYETSNPCYTEYAGWARRADDVLEVAVIQTVDIHPPPGTECPADGVEREVHVELDEPFLGSFVKDSLTGRMISIEPRPS